jgi:hypothetical protein
LDSTCRPYLNVCTYSSLLLNASCTVVSPLVTCLLHVFRIIDIVSSTIVSS